MKCIYEHFNSIYDFSNALKTRPVNDVFRGKELSSETGSYDFTKTSSLDEANKMIENGYNAKVEEIKNELIQFKKNVVVNKKKYERNVLGFAPSVPDAIKGHPMSMYNYRSQSKEESRNYCHLMYNNGAVSRYSSEQLMKCGITVLKLAIMLEAQGIRTQIDIIPKGSICGDEGACCSVKIKDYRQPFNPLKMAYPISHVSFFRRHGFKWLETVKGIENKYWQSGYGTSFVNCNKSDVEKFWAKVGVDLSEVVYIDVSDCIDAEYNPEQLAVAKNLKK